MSGGFENILPANADTLLTISSFGNMLYQARGLSQTLEVISEATQQERTINGTLINAKSMTLGNSTNALRVSGGFTQGSKGSIKTTITGAGNYGRISAGGALSLAGKVTLKQVKFIAKSGESFAFFAGSERTGEFSSIKGTAIKGGSLSYVPHYTATGLNLVVE